MDKNKKILFGTVLAVFIMLLIPINSAIELKVIENNQNINDKDIFENRVINIISILLQNIKNTYPGVYDEINEKISNYREAQPDPHTCDAIYWFAVLFTISVIFIPYAIFLWILYYYIGCHEIQNECKNCILTELIRTKLQL